MKFSRFGRTQNRKGFTLVELLVVISIIGVLAGLLLVNLSNVRERGRDTQRKSDLNQLKTALRLYFNDYQTYPADDTAEILGCGPGNPEDHTGCTWGGDFTANGTKYMTLPADPIPTAQYRYEQLDGGTGFRLEADLENLSDAQIRESQLRCGATDETIVEGVFVVCTD